MEKGLSKRGVCVKATRSSESATVPCMVDESVGYDTVRCLYDECSNIDVTMV